MATKRTLDAQQVLQTAITLADQEGFEAVTLARVAEILGIRIPSLYNHISSLAGLRSEMALWAVRQVGETMRRAAVGKTSDEAIVSVSEAIRTFALAHPGVYAQTQKVNSYTHPELAAVQREVLDIFLAILASYGLTQEDRLHAVRALRSIVHGFIDLEVLGGFEMALDRDESFRRLIHIFIAGLHLSHPGSHKA